MDMKIYVWGGLFAGAGIGSLLPVLWGDTAGEASLWMTLVGGFVGLLVGYRLGKQLGV